MFCIVSFAIPKMLLKLIALDSLGQFQRVHGSAFGRDIIWMSMNARNAPLPSMKGGDGVGGGGGFGGFFAFTGAARQLVSAMPHGAFEETVVVRSLRIE